ncbi:hypothetical protein ACFVUS_03795 [Nocardia sp. NPDC058058]|uniref:hypothetical protein n=1 Tax=Nocardia sp. NPDC058058 TaxID=3346317 RepID=UPI0036D90CBD
MHSPTDHTARLRGAAVGAASGAVAIFAHGLGGGTTAPAGSALALLFAACALIGVIVAAVRPGYGPIALMGMLAAGQGIGHIALSMSPGHHHHAASPAMLVAHLIAIPVGAMAIRAAEAGMRRAVTSVRRFILALADAPVPAERGARPTATAERATARLLAVTPGIARRGPPARARHLSHLAPA